MKALKKQQIAVILVLSVILSTFAAVTPVSAATQSAQQYLEKMDIAVRNLKSYDFKFRTAISIFSKYCCADCVAALTGVTAANVLSMTDSTKMTAICCFFNAFIVFVLLSLCVGPGRWFYLILFSYTMHLSKLILLFNKNSV